MAAERLACPRAESMAEASAVTLASASPAAVLSSRQNASSSVMEVRCPATVSERFFGKAKPGSKDSRKRSPSLGWFGDTGLTRLA